jgi:hypothetical protein
MAGRRVSKVGGRVAADTPRVSLPPGTPNWITPELVEQTLAVWQPRYQCSLSVEDAVAILMGAERLVRTLLETSSPEN